MYGFALADRNYWKPELFERLQANGVQLLAPYKFAKRQKQPWPRFLTHMRYRRVVFIYRVPHKHLNLIF
jgi:hypothetical protein